MKTHLRFLITLAALAAVLAGASASCAADVLVLPARFEEEAARATAACRASGGVRHDGGASAGILGGIAPHDGLALSVITEFYERAASPKVRRVWLFSPDHFRRARKPAAFCGADWKLSGGILKADAGACAALGELRSAEENAPLFAREHGIMTHIPFIARYFPNAAVVPIVLRSDITDLALASLRGELMELIGENDIIILSMDLSHGKTPEGLAAEDAKTLPILTELRYIETNGADIDARRAAALVLRIFRDLGAKGGTLLRRTDTSELRGSRVESGSSCASIIYSAEKR